MHRQQQDERNARAVAAGVLLMNRMTGMSDVIETGLGEVDGLTSQVNLLTGVPSSVRRGVKFYPDGTAEAIQSLRRKLIAYSAALGRLETAITKLRS